MAKERCIYYTNLSQSDKTAMDDLLEEVKTFICIDCEKVFTAESGTMGFCEACFKPEKREEVKQRPLYN